MLVPRAERDVRITTDLAAAEGTYCGQILLARRENGYAEPQTGYCPTAFSGDIR
jgi:hypothetical protein